MDEDGFPNLSIAPIEIRTLGRLKTATADPWWVDEIVCSVSLISSGARLELEGQIPSRNFQFFLSDLQLVYESLEGTAQLDGSDLGLVVRIKALPQGHMSVEAEVWLYGIWDGPFRASFRLDQTHLPPMLAQLRAILEVFPVRADRGLL